MQKCVESIVARYDKLVACLRYFFSDLEICSLLSILALLSNTGFSFT